MFPTHGFWCHRFHSHVSTPTIWFCAFHPCYVVPHSRVFHPGIFDGAIPCFQSPRLFISMLPAHQVFCRSLSCLVQLKVKGPDIYIPPLTGKPKQQQFASPSGVLTSTSSRWCGTVIGSPLSKRMGFGPTVAARQTHICPGQPHYGLHSAMFSSTTTDYFRSEYYQVLTATHLPH